jgi:hypothetical protein
MAEALLTELREELTTAHGLWGAAVGVIARAEFADDVLFELDGAAAPYAVVHLTWRGGPETGSFPLTRLCPDWEGALRALAALREGLSPYK